MTCCFSNDRTNLRYEDTGNDSVIEFSRNAEDTTRGTKPFHQSPINRGRFSDDNIKENSLKHKNNTQQITKINKIMDIKC